MKILIVRHGDPDYSIDSLTPKGRNEAELLSQKLSKLDIKEFYVSVLGRAKATAEYTLRKMNRKAIECEWLKEFPVRIDKPNVKKSVAWDWLPEDWTENDAFFDPIDWRNVSIMKDSGVTAEYDRVTSEFDKIIAKHGYVRDGRKYITECGNEDTIVFFCHFGLECVLLSHLLNIPPMPLWHGTCALTTSVTTVVTEERRKGIAYFRMNAFSDTSHLYIGGEEPSFAARFCETYENTDQRHD